jgi:acetyltransferase-like isoleucine patch superfamily enzyme
MSDFLYRVLEQGVSSLKKRDYRLDRSIPLSLLTGMLLRRFAWLARGAVKCLVLQRRLGLVFMAPKVNLRNAALIRFGKGVTLERGVIVDGLSRNGVEFGDNVVIGPYSVVRASSPSNLGAGLRMGNNSAIDAFSFIGASGTVSVGENVIMGQHVSFHAENHNYDRTDVAIKHQGTRQKGIVVEENCWVGSNTVFLDGSHIGRGCVIAAGSVVKGYIPPNSVAGGIPARVIKSRGSVDSGMLTSQLCPRDLEQS